MTTDRKSRRAMLALIALATDLPMPESVHLYEDTGLLALTFARVADGRLWVTHLGGTFRDRVSDRRYVGQYGVIEWHGWQVTVNGSEPIDLTDDESAALTELAEGGENP